MNAKILGTGFYVPDEIIPNSMFDDGKPWYFYDANSERIKDESSPSGLKQTFLTDEKIRKISGIRERRKSGKDEYAHHLAAIAGKRALDAAGMPPADLEGIIVANVTQDSPFPSTAVKTQALLGASRVRDAYDIAFACAGFPLGLRNARDHILNGHGPYLVIGVETLTKITDYIGRDVNATLFSDGAGACVVVPSDEEAGILAYASRSDPFHEKLFYILRDRKGFLRMPQGPYVMKNAVKSMAAATIDVLERTRWPGLQHPSPLENPPSPNELFSQVDYFIFHQANNNITEGLIASTGIPREKVGNNIHKYGNMSAATCPVLLAEAVLEGKVHEGSRVILSSFGSGLVTSAIAVQF